MLTFLIILGLLSVGAAVVAIIEKNKEHKKAEQNWEKFQKKHPGGKQ